MANKKPPQFLTQEETKRLLAAIKSKRDYALFLIAYRHGLRASEIGLLEVDDIDLKQFTIFIRRLKGSHSGIHPIRPDEAKAVKAMLKERKADSPYLFLSRLSQPISRRMLDVLMKNYATEAGIPQPKRHFHILKHSAGTHLSSAGADLRVIQDWLGHVNVQNTDGYTQITNKKRNDEARRRSISTQIV